MAGIRQFLKPKSTVEDDGILCKKIEKLNAFNINIADSAISCHVIADNRKGVLFHLSKLTYWNNLKRLLTQIALLVAITREQDVFSLRGSDNIHV